MRNTSFQSRTDGEYAQCPSCAPLYGADAWLPATSEYWPTHKGRLLLNQCKACRADRREGRTGIVPNTAQWLTVPPRCVGHSIDIVAMQGARHG